MSPPSKKARVGVLVPAFMIVAALTTTAHAARTAGGPESSAIAQYVEMVPTGTGERPVGVGAAKTKLPPKIERQVEHNAGADAPALVEASTSSAYGAPTEPPPPPAPTQHTNSKPRSPGRVRPDAIPVAVVKREPVPQASFRKTVRAIVAGSLSERLLVPALGLFLVTAAGAAVALMRHRET